MTISDIEKLRKEVEGRRFCYYVTPTKYDAGKGGYQIGIVYEDLPGYYLIDMYLGDDYVEANRIIREKNRSELGLSEDDEMDIIGSSIFRTEQKKKKGKDDVKVVH